MLNAHFQTGLANPLDEAHRRRGSRPALDVGADRKVDEIPYDFVRKRLSVVVEPTPHGARTADHQGRARRTCWQLCDRVRGRRTAAPLDDATRAAASSSASRDWSGQGYRVLGVAPRTVDARSRATTAADERG